MNLYIFYVGGNAGRSNIEVHDVQFAVVNKPEDAWPLLREAWFGDKNKIHLDGYAVIDWADGYNVTLSCEPDANPQKLFFVNAGAYRSDTLAELHEFDLFVADNAAQAKAKALSTLLCGFDQQHKDNLVDVDDCILLEKIGDYYIHLEANTNGTRFKPAWQGYLPIGE